MSEPLKSNLAMVPEAMASDGDYPRPDFDSDDLKNWQVNAIREGLAEAGQGLLIDHEEIEKEWEARVAAQMDAEGQKRS